MLLIAKKSGDFDWMSSSMKTIGKPSVCGHTTRQPLKTFYIFGTTTRATKSNWKADVQCGISEWSDIGAQAFLIISWTTSVIEAWRRGFSTVQSFKQGLQTGKVLFQTHYCVIFEDESLSKPVFAPCIIILITSMKSKGLCDPKKCMWSVLMYLCEYCSMRKWGWLDNYLVRCLCLIGLRKYLECSTLCYRMWSICACFILCGYTLILTTSMACLFSPQNFKGLPTIMPFHLTWHYLFLVSTRSSCR